MTNQLLTTDLISNVTLATFVNETPFIHTSNRALQADFMMPSYRIGDSVNIRKQNRFITGDGQVANVQDILEESETLTLSHQYHEAIKYSSRDLTLKMDDFKVRYIDPAVRSIATKLEFDVATQAALDLNLFVGTAGTPINSIKTILLAARKLRSVAVDIRKDAYLALNLEDDVEIKNSLSNFFNKTLNQDITQFGELNRLTNFDTFSTQNIYRQTSGSPGAGPITVIAQVSAGNGIAMTGFTPNTLVFRTGDLFSIDGVTNVNPLNYQSTGDDAQFVVTQDVTSDGAGNAFVAFNPTIVISGARQNISGAIPAGAVVTPIASHNVNVAFIRQSLDLAMPPLEKLDVPFTSVVTDPETNVSMRISKQGDIINDINVLRLDVLCGFKWHPEYAVRVIS